MESVSIRKLLEFKNNVYSKQNKNSLLGLGFLFCILDFCTVGYWHCVTTFEKINVYFLFSLFLIVPGLQNEQKRFQLEELRKFGAQFKVRKVWE